MIHRNWRRQTATVIALVLASSFFTAVFWPLFAALGRIFATVTGLSVSPTQIAIVTVVSVAVVLRLTDTSHSTSEHTR